MIRRPIPICVLAILPAFSACLVELRRASLLSASESHADAIATSHVAAQPPAQGEINMSRFGNCIHPTYPTDATSATATAATRHAQGRQEREARARGEGRWSCLSARIEGGSARCAPNRRTAIVSCWHGCATSEDSAWDGDCRCPRTGHCGAPTARHRTVRTRGAEFHLTSHDPRRPMISPQKTRSGRPHTDR